MQHREEFLLAREQRKLTAILAADVVGCSCLMGRDESATLAQLPDIEDRSSLILKSDSFCISRLARCPRAHLTRA